MSVLPVTLSNRLGWRPRRWALASYRAAMGSLVRRSVYSGHVDRYSIRQPAALAPPSRQASTRSLRSCRVKIVPDRTYHSATVWLGTMFGLSPALVNTPWMRSLGL